MNSTPTATGVIRWGLVGTNGYARRTCAPAFDQVATAELVAVASSDLQRATAFAAEVGVPIAHDSMDALCDHDEIDAVWIASPSHLHHRHGRIALEAGKHVLMEKPLALNAEEAWDLVRLARETGRLLATGYQARYVPAHQRMKQLIDEGVIGATVVARTFYGNPRSGPPRTWRAQRETARWGALADIGTHHLDLLRMLMGEVSEVLGVTAHRRGFETDDTVTATLRFESGAVGSLIATSAVAFPSTVVEVHGTEGSLTASGTSPDGQGTATLRRGGDAPQDITGLTPLSSVAQLDAVSRTAAGETIAYASGEDGARNVELLERISP